MNPVSRASRKLNVNPENKLDLSKARQIQCAVKEFWNGPQWCPTKTCGFSLPAWLAHLLHLDLISMSGPYASTR
jgi:hypothetical protein